MATAAAVVGEFLEYFAKAYFRLPMDTAYSRKLTVRYACRIRRYGVRVSVSVHHWIGTTPEVASDSLVLRVHALGASSC